MRPLLIVILLLQTSLCVGAMVENAPRCIRGSDSSPGIFADGRIRAAVIEGHEHDASVFAAVRDLGANTIVTHAAPDAETASLAHSRELFYIA